eukprot:jgi/Psemu1/22759/gm1.22759_g
MVAYDWRALDEISFQFLGEANPAAAEKLNDRYSEFWPLTTLECKDLFLESNDKSMILAPDPLSNLRGVVLQTIEANLQYMADLQTDHIAQLLTNSNLDHAARDAVEQAAKHGKRDSAVFLEVSIEHWEFQPNLNTILFHKIYEDSNVTIPSDATGLIPTKPNDPVFLCDCSSQCCQLDSLCVHFWIHC